MAITIKPMNGITALAKLGVAQDSLDWLKTSPVVVQLTAKQFHLSLPLTNGDDVAMVVPTSLDTLQKLHAGTLSAAEKMLLKSKLEDKIAQMVVLVGANEGHIDETAAKPPKPAVGLGALPPVKPAAPAPAPTVAEPAWTTFDLAKLNTATPVPLRDAKQMYQPVHGTSSGSRYFMVAAGDGIRVAARFKSGSLSVRVEGSKLDSYKSKLLGTQMKMSGDYASLHLKVDTMELASKTLGAVLLGLGIPLDTPIPDLKKVAN